MVEEASWSSHHQERDSVRIVAVGGIVGGGKEHRDPARIQVGRRNEVGRHQDP